MPAWAAPSAPPKRAGRVALHDDEPAHWSIAAPIAARDDRGVELRVGPPGAAELDRGDRRHAVIGRPKMRVLAGQDQARADAAMEERFG